MTRDKDTAPRVVALMPAWNAESFIVPVLESLAAQTYPNLRVLISDDASTDRTSEICAAFAADHANFRLIRQPQNLGWVDNVNCLLREAAPGAEYQFFAFHDDVLLEEYVTRLIEALKERPAAVLAYSDIDLFHLDGERERVDYMALDQVKGRVARARCVLWQHGDWWTPNRGVFRSSAAMEIGGMRKNLAGEYSADWPWLLHLSLLGEFVRVPEMLCRKYYREKSVSRNWNVGILPQLAVTLACAAEISRSRLTGTEKIRLFVTIAARCVMVAVRRFIRPLRSLNFRAEEPER